jgi:hypothetical protein|tara:strand:+ start:79 stop:270 length:192 start_codon:yes stop_codon:yes gene_type:complete
MKRCMSCNKRVKDGSGKGVATISGYFCDKKCAMTDMRTNRITMQENHTMLTKRLNKESGWWTK